MELIVYALLLGLALAFLSIYVLTPKNTGFLIVILSGVIFLVVGGFQLLEGVDLKVGESTTSEVINENVSLTVTNYNFQPVTGLFDYLSVLWLLVGLGVIGIGVFDVLKSSKW